MQQDVLSVVRNVSRLMSLHNSGLLDTPAEEVFDRFTRLAAHLLKTRTALLSLVDADRQFFKSAQGLDEPLASKRETPLSHSICKHVVELGTGLVIPDGRVHPTVRDSPAVHDNYFVAYAGMPVFASDGQILGTLCVIDNRPREWTEADLAALRDLAACVTEEITLRTRLRASEAAYQDSELRRRRAEAGTGRSGRS